MQIIGEKIVINANRRLIDRIQDVSPKELIWKVVSFPAYVHSLNFLLPTTGSWFLVVEGAQF